MTISRSRDMWRSAPALDFDSNLWEISRRSFYWRCKKREKRAHWDTKGKGDVHGWKDARKVGRFGGIRMKMRRWCLSGDFFSLSFFFTTCGGVCARARFTKTDKAKRESKNDSRSINSVTCHSSCCRIRFTAISFAICRSWASLRSARNWNVKEKCNVYSHTTSIFQDFST